nr:immunoglobulin heavy chain junction region [Mus musculus]
CTTGGLRRGAWFAYW